MSFQWDPHKADSNAAKHGVRFADAVAIFEDVSGITIPYDFPGEERFVTIGQDFLGRILVVVYTWRGNTIRIISARKATHSERKHYRRD